MNKYQVEDDRLKLLYTRNLWRPPLAETYERTALSPSRSDCVRLSFVNEFGSGVLIARWLERRITWRKLWRIVSEFPGEFAAQVDAVKPKRERKKVASVP